MPQSSDMEALQQLRKGFPPRAVPESIGQLGLNVLRDDCPMPLAILKEPALAANAKWMSAFRELAGVDLCPHGKTTMSPELFRRQIADGAWGITCATAYHLEVYRAAGVKCILFANQLIGRANLEMALRHLRDPSVEIYILVDSAAGAKALSDAAVSLSLSRPVTVLLEVGDVSGRTGVRGLDEALALADVIARDPKLELAGVETFEGIYGHSPDCLNLADRLLEKTAEFAKALDAAGAFKGRREIILSAGGTDFFDRVALHFKKLELSVGTRIVVRSGCYVSFDSTHYAGAFERSLEHTKDLAKIPGKLEHAMEVWGHVQSMPEPGLALCSLGRRDASFDWDLPVPICWARPGASARAQAIPARHETKSINDQHLFVAVPDGSPLRIGDLVGFGISHPCTTFDKWRSIPVVDADYNVIDCVNTYF